MRFATILTAAGVSATIFCSTPTSASGADAGEACRTYRVALQSARAALADGKREVALAALRQAKLLLAACRREEARNAVLLATERGAAPDA